MYNKNMYIYSVQKILCQSLSRGYVGINKKVPINI